MCGGRGIQEISLHSQFCYKPKNALKKQNLLKKTKIYYSSIIKLYLLKCSLFHSKFHFLINIEKYELDH